jgi:hypothetical protein
MRKRLGTPFSLSFLDIIFCGFGAVVLLVMILHGQVLQKREEKKEDLQGELDRVTALYDFARAHIATQRRNVVVTELEEGELQVQVNQLLAKIQNTQQGTGESMEAIRERERAIKEIEKKKTALESATKIFESRKFLKRESGERAIGFAGDGQRQYLTGLKLGGKRTLILVDSSASMLDETIVNIVRRKIMSPASRRRAPKWQRAVRSLHWLVANLRRDNHFQIYYFNTEARPLIAGTDRQWLDTNDANLLKNAITAIRQLVPGNGTSLHKALLVAQQFDPAPDSIVLLTDGLPTLGLRSTEANSISAEGRLKLFEAATARLPVQIPINTLLFPMEGDPGAAEAFWRLAIATDGSFITPSRDWP